MSWRILLCDDQLHILRAAEFKFRRIGCQVYSAWDGEEAWKMIQEQRPDILVTDQEMPNLDGISLTRRLRQCTETRDMPVILVTEKDAPTCPLEVQRELEIQALLPKPFSPRELHQIVARTLETQATSTSL